MTGAAPEPYSYAEVRGPYGGRRGWRVYITHVGSGLVLESLISSHWTRAGARRTAQAAMEPDIPERPRVIERIDAPYRTAPEGASS